MTTDGARPRRRRPHAAAGGRLLVGGLSLSLLVGLVGAMVRGDRSSAAPTVSTDPTASIPAGPTATAGPQVPPTVQVTRPTTPPVTTSHAT